MRGTSGRLRLVGKEGVREDVWVTGSKSVLSDMRGRDRSMWGRVRTGGLQLDERQHKHAAAEGLPLRRVGGGTLRVEARAAVEAHAPARAVERARRLPPRRLVGRAGGAHGLGGAYARHAHGLRLVAEIEARAELLVGEPVDGVVDALHRDLEAQIAVARGRSRQLGERRLQVLRAAPERRAAGTRKRHAPRLCCGWRTNPLGLVLGEGSRAHGRLAMDARRELAGRRRQFTGTGAGR